MGFQNDSTDVKIDPNRLQTLVKLSVNYSKVIDRVFYFSVILLF